MPCNLHAGLHAGAGDNWVTTGAHLSERQFLLGSSYPCPGNCTNSLASGKYGN